jgi:hypothetical protein
MWHGPALPQDSQSGLLPSWEKVPEGRMRGAVLPLEVEYPSICVDSFGSLA